MITKETVFVKNVDGLTLPNRVNNDDAGYDIVATSDPEIHDTYIQYRTGLFLKIPDDCYVDIRPRSSISKYNLILCNSVGLCDAGYLGEYLIRFKYVPSLTPVEGENNSYAFGQVGDKIKIYQKGDKIAQLVIRKRSEMEFVVVDNFDFETNRGTGGHGSTGN